MTADSARIFLVSGSIRAESYTRTLTALARLVLEKRGADAVHWNLREAPLPTANPEFHHDPYANPNRDVQEFVALTEWADACVWSSPIHHNSYSGVLKNALDHLAIRNLRYKPVGLLSHGGNRSSQAVDHLRIVARGLMAVAIPTQVCSAKQDFALSPSGGYELTSSDIAARLDRFAAEILLFAELFRQVRELSDERTLKGAAT